MTVETHTGSQKKKLVDAVKEDLLEDATKALSTAREIFQARRADLDAVVDTP